MPPAVTHLLYVGSTPDGGPDSGQMRNFKVAVSGLILSTLGPKNLSTVFTTGFLAGPRIVASA